MTYPNQISIGPVEAARQPEIVTDSGPSGIVGISGTLVTPAVPGSTEAQRLAIARATIANSTPKDPKKAFNEVFHGDPLH